MYLSKLALRADCAQARGDLGNPHNLHRTIMGAFPSPLPPGERVLFRVESFNLGASPIVLVQSQSLPDWRAVEDKFNGYFDVPVVVKGLDGLRINTGRLYRFRLRANPCKRVIYKQTQKSQRVSFFSEKDRRAWLIRKAGGAGFSLVEERLLIRDAPYRTVFMAKDGQTRKGTFNMVDFDGLLRVEDVNRFLAAIQAGIGPAKGLGCGLLSLARA